MAEVSADFVLYPFIRELFEDLSLTLPSLGCRFEGALSPSDQSARGQRSHLKNKLFLLFADLSLGSPDLKVKFSLALNQNRLELCFFCSPDPLKSNDFPPSWDPEFFQRIERTEGSGFSVLVEEGPFAENLPPLDWRELARLYGSPEAGRKMLEAFFARAEVLVPQLQDEIEKGNVPEALRLAHTLKGSSRGVYAQRLAGTAHKIEMVCRCGGLEGVQELYRDLLESQKELSDWVRKGES